MKARKTRQILLLSFAALLVLSVSFISHLQIGWLADKWLDKTALQPMLFSEWQGDLREGSAHLMLSSKEGKQSAAHLAWQHSLLDWLWLQPTVEVELSGLHSRLHGVANYSIIAPKLQVGVQDGLLSSVDLQPLWQLNRQYGRWMQGVEGELRQLNLQAQWQGQNFWPQQILGTAQLVGLQFMGEAFPPIKLELSQNEEAVLIRLQAQQGWHLQGEIRLTPMFDGDRLQAVTYQGSVKVRAESAESLPNWASLMRAQGENTAITQFTGQFALN